MADDIDLTEARLAVLEEMGWPDDRGQTSTEPGVPAEEYWSLAGEIVDAIAPLVIEQARQLALTEAYWKIRVHGSSYRAARVFRRAWERAEANRDDERARHHLAVHEFYARGIASAADDVGGMLGCEPGEEPPLSCGCPPEHHDEAKRRLADTMRRDGTITEEVAREPQ